VFCSLAGKMHVAKNLSTLVLVALSQTACKKDEASQVWSIPVDDGGYALVRAEVPQDHDLRVKVTIEDAEPGETYVLLHRAGNGPSRVGWVDLSAFADRARDCARRDVDGSACDPQGAGRFVSVATAGSGVVELSHVASRCDDDDDDDCTAHYAILSLKRLSSARRASFAAVTKGYFDADPARLQLLH